MKSMSPPTEVHARPTATPGTFTSLYISLSKEVAPNISLISSTLEDLLYSSSKTTDLAVLLMTEATFLSKLLTPDSLV